jgi:hypothetical protein
MTKKAKQGKTESSVDVVNISDFDRMKTILLILKGFKEHNPSGHEFYWKPERMLSPLRDQFDMERAFKIIAKETKGNVEAKYETADVFSEATGKSLGMHRRAILLRIKNDEQFFRDYKRIDAKKEKDTRNVIEKIEIIENERGDKLRVFINGDYTNEKITPEKESDYWIALLEIAKEKKVVCDSNRSAKSIVDFFNTNQDNMLYTRSGYALSQILTKENNVASALIPIKVITKKAVTQRSSKEAA